MPQIPQCRWRQPELSVGSQCASLDILGRYKCWLVKDKSPAHVVWKAVSKPIISLLDDQFEHLDAGDSDLTFEMFMVGRKPTSTVPTIIFSCESKTCRQKAMALVQKKSILAAYPGGYMAEYSRLPKPLAQGEDAELLFLPAGVYLNGPLRICGTPVLVSFGPKKSPRKATIGGIICIDETLYGVTAGHAFTQHKASSSSDVSDDEFSFFGGGDPFESSEDEDESVELTSQASMSSGSSQSPSTNDFDFGGRRRKSLTSSLSSGSTQTSAAARGLITQKDPVLESIPERYGTLFAFSDPDERLDWALVKVENPALLRFPRPDEYMANNMRCGNNLIYPNSIAHGSLDADVVVCTGSSGVVQGRLSGVTAYKRAARQRGFQQLSTMVLSMGTFNDGDCGSWVCDLRTGAVYGHIISGHTGTGSAYLVQSEHIFQDMETTLEKSVQLLTRSLAARNAALALWGHIDTDKLLTAGSEAQQVMNSSLPIPGHSIPEPVHAEPMEVVGKPDPNRGRSLKARPAYVEDVDEEGNVISSMRKIASYYEASKPNDLLLRTRSKREDIISDSGYSSGKLTTSRAQSSADQSMNPTVSLIPARAPGRSVKRDRKEHFKKDTKVKQRKSSRPGAQKTQKGERPLSSTQYSTIDVNSSDTSGRHIPSNFGSVPPRPIGNVQPPSIQTSHLRTRDTLPLISQSIPLRTRASPTVASRPVSYYGTGPSGYPSGLPLGTAPTYPPMQAFPVPHTYPAPFSYSYQTPGYYPDQYQQLTQTPITHTAGAQFHDPFSPQSRLLSTRFGPAPTSRDQRSLHNVIDDEYISANEVTDLQNMHIPPRANSAIGTRNFGIPTPPLRRTGSQAEIGDRRPMAPPPPPPPPSGRQWGQYDNSYTQRPQANRRSVSYNIDGPSGLRIEPAASSGTRHRQQSYHGGQMTADVESYDEKIRKAATYQQDMTGAPLAALTIDSMKRRRVHQVPGSQDTRSTKSSADTQSTRSSQNTRSRRSSTSSASSVTSREESGYYKSASTRTRKDKEQDEDVTIKISRGARVTVGGTQIDCNDGGEIVINRLRSVLNEDRAEDRMNYDFPRTESLRRRFDRSTSANEDGKSNLSMRSSNSDETVKGKGKGKGTFDPTASQTTNFSSKDDNQGTDLIFKKNERESKRGIEMAVAEAAARELDERTKKGSKLTGKRCAMCSSGGQDVWVISGRACPVCGTLC
ncbi:hypothetical protein ONS95_012205 [Cadophora gregata]|uniref:uncharacterized protein n=1 Tax=Cadophora gregata TaxID=51156 RepID=UPI0026DB67C0|nr:uncharacterized protein ONS95_012205 [Cadophora gregata]KAK0117886.1 hypothetical protein ONS95_012205 [Cadophora gregata]